MRQRESVAMLRTASRPMFFVSRHAPHALDDDDARELGKIWSKLDKLAESLELVPPSRFIAFDDEGVSADVAASDMLASGVPLPRMTYLLLPVFGVIMALRTGVTPLFRTVLVAVAVLGPLMLLLGYRDEFRALNLALPLLVSAIAATGRDLASTGPSASVAPPLRQSVCFGAVRD